MTRTVAEEDLIKPEKKNIGGTTTCTTLSTTTHATSNKMTSIIIDNRQVKKHIDNNDNGNGGIKISNLQHLSITADNEDYNMIENIEQLRQETKKLHAKYTDQATKIKKLEFDLEMEQGHVNILRHDNQSLRIMAVDLTALTEQEEEYISNKLLKYITGLKKEKEELLVQVEQEEEYLSNMLQKKLVQLQKEKIDLENALEQEQEYMVNRLQKQLDLLLRQQQQRGISDPSLSSLPVSPAIIGIGGYSPSLGASKKWTTTSNESIMILPPPSLVDVLKAEVNSLRQRAIEMEREYFQKQQQCNKYKTELIQYRKENNLSLDDIDDGSLPRVFRSIPPPFSPESRHQTRRSTSNSSISIIPPLNLDTSTSSSSTTTTSHSSSVLSSSPSVSSSSAASRKSTEIIASRRVSGTLFGLNSTPPQHPPQL